MTKRTAPEPTPTPRVDHLRAAEDYVVAAESTLPYEENPTVFASIALAHATIALAQQGQAAPDGDRSVTVTFSIPGLNVAVKVDREWGDNPVFYASQIDRALDTAKLQARAQIEAMYGRQSLTPAANQ